jgi:hypothetical protein
VCVIIVISLHIERISLAHGRSRRLVLFTYIIADPIITSVLHLQFIMDRGLNKQTNYAPLAARNPQTRPLEDAQLTRAKTLALQHKYSEENLFAQMTLLVQYMNKM